MEKSTGSKKIKTAVFISGNGSNLKNLINFSKKINSPIRINLLISNTHLAKGLNYANQFKIKKKVFNFKNKKTTETKILLYLKKNNIKFICLAGFMKILSLNFIKRFNYRIINIHPSLLPKFKGLNTHRRVLKTNEKYTGCTIHFVSPKLDSGKIILQKKILIRRNETEKSLKNKVLRLEHKAYPEAIFLLFK